MDSNFLEILDIPSVDSDCEEISVKKKARVAHKPASEIVKHFLQTLQPLIDLNLPY